ATPLAPPKVSPAVRQGMDDGRREKARWQEGNHASTQRLRLSLFGEVPLRVRPAMSSIVPMNLFARCLARLLFHAIKLRWRFAGRHRSPLTSGRRNRSSLCPCLLAPLLTCLRASLPLAMGKPLGKARMPLGLPMSLFASSCKWLTRKGKWCERC
ncbi:MAG: hypothetical protein SLRJCFUN_001507, partial [Candidatus Fervidibacter sp.]